jgi:hypothetical protein
MNAHIAWTPRKILLTHEFFSIVACEPIAKRWLCKQQRCYAVDPHFYATVEVLLNSNNRTGVFYVVRAEM